MYKIIGGQAYRRCEHIVIPDITRNGEIYNYTEELAKQKLIGEKTFVLLKGDSKYFIICSLMERVKFLLSYSQRQ